MPRPQHPAAPANVKDARVLIVEARYYQAISDALLAGATAALDAAGAAYDVLSVPGALEIPAALAIAVEQAEQAGRPYDAGVALGCVIRGQTFHFEIVATQSARGLMDYSVARRFPVGNGILTVNNEDQAMVRADPKGGHDGIADTDKGGGAARAALSLLAIKRGPAT